MQHCLDTKTHIYLSKLMWEGGAYLQKPRVLVVVMVVGGGERGEAERRAENPRGQALEGRKP